MNLPPPFMQREGGDKIRKDGVSFSRSPQGYEQAFIDFSPVN